MRTEHWVALVALVAASACAPSQWQPVDGAKVSESGTSIRGGVVEGKAAVAGSDAIPERDLQMTCVAIEHLDGGAGVGFRGSAFGNNWDLTDEGPASPTQYSYWSLYPHFTTLASTDLLRVPIRIGPEIRFHELDRGFGSGGKTKYRLLGLAAEVEPEWSFVDNDQFAASLYGRLHIGAGAGTINGPIKDDTQLATSFGGEVGIRLQASVVSLSFGLQGQETRIEPSNDGMGGRDPEAGFRFGGVFISLGAVW